MANKIIIRPINIYDTDNIVSWRNEKNVRNNLFTQSTLSKEQHVNYYNNNIITGKVKQFIIVEMFDGQSKDIGTCFIKNIDNYSRKAEFGIFIGDTSSRGKGYGKEATALTIDYAFNVMKLHRLYLTVFSDNLSAIKAYEKCGFKEEGVLRHDFLKGDVFVDVTIMGIINNYKDEAV